MSDDAVVYFLPWMRRGLAGSLSTEADADGVPTSASGVVTAGVTVAGTEVTRDVAVRGPGSVIGLNASQIVREEPRAGTTDFEVTLFPAVELASPDLPWQFTPAAPNQDRLLPWLVLVVVEERDGVELRGAASGPLPVLAISEGAASELPDLRQAWAWTHVQASVDPGSDVDAVFEERPEAFVARCVCPRRLAEGAWYAACLVPSFEAGRQAGLGLTVEAGATVLAWDGETDAIELPVYHSWRFRTSAEAGDFETLVRRLSAATLADDAGVHDLDVGSPGSDRLPDAPETILGFQGAVVSPTVDRALPVWEAIHREAFCDGMRNLLNEALVADAAEPPDGRYVALRDDPVVAPPAYGALAAGEDVVPGAREPDGYEAPSWLGEVNLDPTLRSAAGVGADVVRRNQETLVASAWDQAAALGEVNRTLNRTRLALEVGKRAKARFEAMEEGARLQFSAGAHARLKRADMTTTVAGRLRESAVPNGLVSSAFRRRMREGSAVARAVAASSGQAGAGAVAAGLTRSFVADPEQALEFARLTVPYGTVFDEDTDSEEATADRLIERLERVETQAWGLARGDVVTTRRTFAARGGLSLEGRTVPAVPAPAHRARTLTASRWSSSVPVAVDGGGAAALDTADLAAVVSEKLDPAALLRVRVRALIQAPWSDVEADVPAAFTFSPAYPDPACELLVRMDPELLMPGVGDIPANTVSVAKVNARFVEAFLLGANHELGREFAWREVPVDPADSWMRTFWGSLPGGTEDIERVAAWDDSALGAHQPADGADPDRILVLVVKGDLLRRYPNTSIYAAPAAWTETDQGQRERVEDGSQPPVYPLFAGQLGRDVTFLGFQFEAGIDLDADVAGSADPDEDRPGWYFVFEQPPTEPRFGLDEGGEADAGLVPATWDAVSWWHALGSATSAAAHVPLAPLSGQERPCDDEGANAWRETWGVDAARMARITLQRPVRMLVHAHRMLPSGEDA